MSRQMRGFGTIYQRGATFWIQYAARGVVSRESSNSTERSKAGKLLKLRLAESKKGRVLGPVAEKVTRADTRAALIADYHKKGNRSLVTAQYFADHLIAYVGENE